jgi:DNA ligase D-like protein (predicted ligase)
MLALRTGEAFDSADYWFEIKWDGIRCLAFVETGAARLQSRNLLDITSRYPAMASIGRHLRGHSRAVIDGELIGFRQGRPSFQATIRSGGSVVLMAFDLLHLDGRDMVDRPIEDRLDQLKKAFAFESELIHAEPVAARGRAYYDAVVGQGLEGIVAKRLGSPYRPGVRSRDWLKIAHRRTMECVICGVTTGAVPARLGGESLGFGSFVLGVCLPGAGYAYVGNVGTGWDAAGLANLLSTLVPQPAPEFAPRAGPPRRIARASVWVRPEVVVEVAYREVTPDGVLRHPSLLRQRPDKRPRECEGWEQGAQNEQPIRHT